jgi:alanyl-tRNA synthetase
MKRKNRGDSMSEIDVKEYSKMFEKLVEIEKEAKELTKDLQNKDINTLVQDLEKKLGKDIKGIQLFVDYLDARDNKHLADDFLANLATNLLMLEKIKKNEKLQEIEKLGGDNIKLFLILTSLDAAFRRQLTSLLL